MTRGLPVLRVVALLGVAAAIIDPGCVQKRRPSIVLRFTDAVPEATRERLEARLAAESRAWADLVPGGRVGASALPALVDADVQIVAGDAAPLLSIVGDVPVALAVQVADPVLEFAVVRAPSRVVPGARAQIHVSMTGVPPGDGTVTVLVIDRESTREVAQRTVDTSDVVDGRLTLDIDFLPVHAARQTLRVTARHEGAASVRATSPADVSVDVMPLEVGIEALEARPSWSMRFARLALAPLPELAVVTDVRVAPGVSVRTAEDGRPVPAGGDGPSVLLVAGVEALREADVARLERDVRERGRALVLLLDDAPAPGGVWRRLWPASLGAARTSPRPIVARIGGHVWRTRQWLSPSLSTGMVPLAYLDTERQSIVSGRALGAGRVVLVSALDGWRWRADDEAGFAHGWQALVRGLAADVPPPVSLTTWVGGHGRHLALHVDVTLRPDLLRDGGLDVTAAVTEAGRQLTLPLFPAGRGRWRGAWRPWQDAAPQVQVRATRQGEVVGSARAVVDVRAKAPTASWPDVERRQRAAQRLAVTEAALADGLRTLRDTTPRPVGERWFVTRTWWYPVLLLAALGCEWILRRALRRR